MPKSFHDIPSFVDAAIECVARAASSARMHRTQKLRVLRRYSIAEVAEFFGADRSFINALMKHPDAPEGEVKGRERTLSVHDIMKLRAIADSRPEARRTTLYWRKPGDQLPVLVMSSQKGGVAKSLTSAHLAQYLNLYYGLRVGVIDGDPQATCSLYFVDDTTSVAGYDVEVYTDFMGVPEAGQREKIIHAPDRLNVFWRPTPWPGLRLIPGGAGIQEADIAMYYLTQTEDPEQKKIYRMLRDALDRWRDAHPPRTAARDLAGPGGRFRHDAYEAALKETLDVVIIDTPPSLTLATLNTIVAADTLIIPQTMKGFDLSTLHIYLASLRDYFSFIEGDTNPVKFRPSRSMILPTIVNRSSDTDLRTIGEIMAGNPDIISPIYYQYSEGAANAFREFKSAYEYDAPKARRTSLQAFIDNANAVNDAIVGRALPNLPGRGYARAFLERLFPEGEVEGWTQTARPRTEEDAA